MTLTTKSLETSRELLISELRENALVHADVVLSSGAQASYYVDAKRSLLRPPGMRVVAELVAARAKELDATAIGGLTIGADAVACAAIAWAAFVDRDDSLKGFFVRKDPKPHGLQRMIEGPMLEPGERCLLVDDVVTTGSSVLRAIDAVRDAGHEICGVVAVLDRLAGGREAIERAADAPYFPLATIDDVYPERPDKAG